MIRINLLAVERQRVKAPSSFQGTQKVTIASSLLLVAALLFVGWWFLALRRESAALDQSIADAELEVQRLQSIIQQVQQFEAQRAQLQQRVALIEELRQGQSGPVHMLDSVSRALPESIWLTEMRQSGAEVTLDGLGASLTALSDFVANLEGTGYFAIPVEIVDSQVRPAAQGAPELIGFTVQATFMQPQTAVVD